MYRDLESQAERRVNYRLRLPLLVISLLLFLMVLFQLNVLMGSSETTFDAELGTGIHLDTEMNPMNQEADTENGLKTGTEMDTEVNPGIEQEIYLESKPIFALVLLGHDRPEYLRECLRSLLAVRSLDKVDIVLSMDDAGQFETLRLVAAEFPDLAITSWETLIPADRRKHTSRDHITTHYAQVFDRLFVQHSDYQFGIILETDLIVSPDFIEYMLAGSALLPNDDKVSLGDSTLFCVSAWSNNGFAGKFKLSEDRLLRTDLFPGYGWMIHGSTWRNILAKEWPGSTRNFNYDAWITELSSVRNRDCVVPEVSRTHHIAKYGTHIGGEASKIYDAMLLASGDVVVPPQEFALVGSMELFEARIKSERLLGAKIVTLGEVQIGLKNAEKLIIFFNTSLAERLTKYFGLFPGKICTAHRGVYGFTTGSTSIALVNEKMKSYWN